MTKRSRAERKAAIQAVSAATSSQGGIEAFSFGEPEAIDRLALFDYMQVLRNSRWYEPPISMVGLANMSRMSPHHASAIRVRRNLLVASFEATRYMSVGEFSAFVNDYIVFGNCYLEDVRSITGKLLGVKRALAMYTRVGLEPGQFWFDTGNGEPFQFEARVTQLMDADVAQEIYGVPEYLAALHAAMLNQSATLFRRRYYDNGSHAGFILYVSDPAQSPSDIDAMREALRKSKGPGNFRNLFMYSPNGKKDGVQLIPISEVAAKDDFAAIKNTSRDDILAAHRVPPQLLGVVPVNAGGFGDIATASAVFMANEIAPLQAIMRGVNDVVGAEVIKFKTAT